MSQKIEYKAVNKFLTREELTLKIVTVYNHDLFQKLIIF